MKTILIAIGLVSAMSAQAESFKFKCNQVRTTAQEARTNAPLKSFRLNVVEGKATLNAQYTKIATMDERLLRGGAPLTHVEYGGYFTSTKNEIFVCKRPM